jgi:hypothetical protein
MNRVTVAPAVIAAALSGCVAYGGFVPGVSTMNDVRSRSGRPTEVRFSPGGDEIWEYATGPQGYETYVVVFDDNGVVRSDVQVLTEDNIKRLVAGKTTRAEVRELLGRPGDAYVFGDSEAWEWRFKPVGFAAETLVVSFGKDGIVTKVDRVMDAVGGRNRGRR